MNAAHFLAVRYLKSNQENRFFSWITILSVIGIAIGVAALIVVLSVINGFEQELHKRFLHANAHIIAYRYPAGMDDPDRWIQLIKADFPQDIKGISAFVHFETMAKSGSMMQGVLVRGFVPKDRDKVQSLEGLITPPDGLDAIQKESEAIAAGQSIPETPSIVIGAGLKDLLGVDVGGDLSLVSPRSNGGSALRNFKVAGIYNSGLKHYDNRLIVMALPTSQEFFNTGKIVTGLEIGLVNVRKSAALEAQMQEKYALTFREWQSFNRPLFEAMQKERLLIGVIVAMVGIVAAFNILTTIFVSVSQKQKEISILKALGASNNLIVRLFINQSAYIGVVGALSGGLLALGISWVLENYVSKILDLPDPYFLKTLPVTYDVSVYIGIVTAAILICIVAGIYPAKIASNIRPSAGFRGNEGVA